MQRAPAISCFRFLHYSWLVRVSQPPESRSGTHKDSWYADRVDLPSKSGWIQGEIGD
jgi:hypothetical protein